MAVNKRKILESAQKHLQKGALDKALEDYQTLLKADSKDSNVRLKVGDLQLKLGRTQDAIDCYLRVAQQFTSEGFDAKAVALYKQISKLDDKRFEVHAQLGELYQRMGLTSEALKALQLAADGAYRTGDKSKALDLLRRMGALDPTNTTSRQKVADLLRQEGRPDEALAEYDEIVKELERQKNAEEQLRVLERMLEISPERADTLRPLSRVAADNGAWPRAESAARKLLAANADDVDALQLLGRALEGAGRKNEAAGVFRDVAERFRARGDEDRARELMQRYGGGGPLAVDDSEPMLIESRGDELELDGGDAPSLALDVPVDDVHDGDWPEPVPPKTPAAKSAPQPKPAPAPKAAPAPKPAPAAKVEPPKPVPAPKPAPPVAAPAPAAAAEAAPEPADLEQLLAEASVLLRYGKHDRAVETLRAALRVEPGHPLALEKLATALLASGNPAHASSALQRAIEGYVAAGDDEGAQRARDLLQKADPDAAAALAKPVEEPTPDAPAEDDAGEIEIDLDAGDLTGGDASEAPPTTDADFSGIEIESGDVSFDGAPSEPIERGAADAGPAEIDDPAAFSFREDESESTSSFTAPVGDAAEPAAAQASRAPTVDADLEEAEFYRSQGMHAEARALYERVLAAVPNHPKASLRLGELDAAAQQAAAAPAPPAAAAEDDLEIDLDAAGDDLQPEAPAPTPPPPAPPPPPPAPARAAPPPVPRAAPVPVQAQPPRPEPRKVEPVAEVPPPILSAAEEPPGFALPGDFDLAAELSGIDDERPATRSEGTEAEAFQEVFAAFKAGVRREVGEGDFEAHYDLGIAYKEMGLLEDAIGEFQAALGSASRRLACLHLMGLCALDLGRSGDAVAHISQALASGALPPQQEAALRVDLGRAYAAAGDRGRARTAYQAALALDSTLPGVAQLIAELDAAPAASALGAAAEGEGLESFDDLIEESPEAPAPAAHAYESFDDLMGGDEEAPAEEGPEPSANSASVTAVDFDPAPEPEAEPAPPPRPAPRPQAPRAPAAPAAPPTAAQPPASAAKRKKKISFV